MHGSHFHPKSLLLMLIVLAVILVVGSAMCDILIFGRMIRCMTRKTHFDGHVLCRVGNGTAEVPVQNAEVKLMEEDLDVFIDRDDLLATTKTDAEGAFSVDGESTEDQGSIEPYLLIKACRSADDESTCNEKKFTPPANVVVRKNYNYFLDDEFCQHCEAGRECKSAEREQD